VSCQLLFDLFYFLIKSCIACQKLHNKRKILSKIPTHQCKGHKSIYIVEDKMNENCQLLEDENIIKRSSPV